MKTVTVTFTGGPLNGRSTTTQVPKHWKFLRYEHKTGDVVQAYFGKITGKWVTVGYVGAEILEVANVT